jgi:hypothetical protein
MDNAQHDICEEMMADSKWIPHIIKEGSREHVVCWDSNGRHCSEPNCEVNKPLPDEIAEWEAASDEDFHKFLERL